LRVVLDTNVVVSALLLDASVSRYAFDRAFERGRVLLSLPVLTELYEVLARPMFGKYVAEQDVRLFLSAYVQKVEWIEISESIRACRDPKDDKILELAASGHASHIISGDNDLISLNPFRGIVVTPPAAFLREFE
jgi:uncharacterized protein